MKRYSLLLAGAIAAGLVGGCAQDKKDDKSTATSQSKFGLLNGSTKNVHDAAHGGADDGPEPEVNADTRFAAGQLAESRDQIDCAIVQYDQALRLNPNHLASLYRLG